MLRLLVTIAEAEKMMPGNIPTAPKKPSGQQALPAADNSANPK
jgi:hypothetical protein